MVAQLIPIKPPRRLSDLSLFWMKSIGISFIKIKLGGKRKLFFPEILKKIAMVTTVTKGLEEIGLKEVVLLN